jgi:hypothetical protein
MKKVIIISVIVALISLIVFFVLRYFKSMKTQTENEDKGFVATQRETAKQIVRDLWTKGLNPAMDYSLKIHILESGHFSSNIFKKTNGAGTLAVKKVYPYGWTSLKSFWDANPNRKPIGYYTSLNGLSYLTFKELKDSIASVATIVANKIQTKGHAGYYYSNNKNKADKYLAKINKIDLSEY